MTKEDNDDFENSTKYWICDNFYVHCNVKMRDHCHITGKYGGSAHGDCDINVKLNHKISAAFYNVKIMIHILLWKKYGDLILN